MNYREALEYIENTGKFGINLGLKRIERLCELLGNPEKKLRVIHVAGTNGKGSTTTLIASMLIKQGYKVGIYTSPYIERFTERIKVNETEIGEEEVAGIVTDMLPLIDCLALEGLEHPTEFEIITAAAFKYFYEKETDFVVLEVGLGGRYDATNVITPLVSVVTTISLDHMNILGDTIGKIAYEKAGIIKEKTPVVIYPQEKEAMKILLEAAEEKRSKAYLVEEMKYELIMDSIDGITFNAEGSKSYNDLKLSLLGEHQIINALTAIKCIEVLKEIGCEISEEAIHEGISSAKWPGRFEILKSNPYIVLDGGHNIEGVKALVRASKKYFRGTRIRIVCGMLKDKNYEDMIDELMMVSEDFITVAPDNPRALSAEELREVIEGKGKRATAAQNIKEAVLLGLSNTKSDEVLLFCGSLYMIGTARTIIKDIVNIN